MFIDFLLLFLYIGVTCALHQSVRSLPVSKESSKIIVMMGASSTLSCFKVSGLILSGPAALPGLRLNNGFKIPLSEISMSGIVCFFVLEIFWYCVRAHPAIVNHVL